MWSNKNWVGGKKKQEKEKLEQNIDGSSCKFCSELPENKCFKCGAEICPQHTKYHRNKFSSPPNEIYCPDCRKKRLIRRIIRVSLTIAGLVTIASQFYP